MINHLILEEGRDIDEAEGIADKVLRELWPCRYRTGEMRRRSVSKNTGVFPVFYFKNAISARRRVGWDPELDRQVIFEIRRPRGHGSGIATRARRAGAVRGPFQAHYETMSPDRHCECATEWPVSLQSVRFDLVRILEISMNGFDWVWPEDRRISAKPAPRHQLRSPKSIRNCPHHIRRARRTTHRRSGSGGFGAKRQESRLTRIPGTHWRSRPCAMDGAKAKKRMALIAGLPPTLWPWPPGGEGAGNKQRLAPPRAAFRIASRRTGRRRGQRVPGTGMAQSRSVIEDAVSQAEGMPEFKANLIAANHEKGDEKDGSGCRASRLPESRKSRAKGWKEEGWFEDRAPKPKCHGDPARRRRRSWRRPSEDDGRQQNA